MQYQIADNAGNNRKINPSPGRFNEGNSGANIRLFRYADLLLIAAEASYELGNSAEALKYLNLVRERGRAGNEEILTDVTTTKQT